MTEPEPSTTTTTTEVTGGAGERMAWTFDIDTLTVNHRQVLPVGHSMFLVDEDLNRYLEAEYVHDTREAAVAEAMQWLAALVERYQRALDAFAAEQQPALRAGHPAPAAGVWRWRVMREVRCPRCDRPFYRSNLDGLGYHGFLDGLRCLWLMLRGER